MRKNSAALDDAFQLLRNDLYEYLEEAEYLPDRLRHLITPELAPLAQVVGDLVTVVRGVVVQHKADDDVVCTVCKTEYPCLAVSTIRELVKDPDRVFVELITAAREG
jgi:hypothetical protein